MLTKITGEAPFQVLTSSFSISPSEQGYTLNISADGENYSPLFSVAAGVTRLVTGVASGSFYKLVGNSSEVVINWNKSCSNGGGGGSEYILPAATSETLGGIKVGDGLSIDANGVLSSSGGSVDLSAYWTSAETSTAIQTVSAAIPTAVSQLTNDEAYVSSGGFKTVNNESIVGEGNITIETGDNHILKSSASVPSGLTNGDVYAIQNGTTSKTIFTLYNETTWSSALLNSVNDGVITDMWAVWDAGKSFRYFVDNGVEKLTYSEDGVVLQEFDLSTEAVSTYHYFDPDTPGLGFYIKRTNGVVTTLRLDTPYLDGVSVYVQYGQGPNWDGNGPSYSYAEGKEKNITYTFDKYEVYQKAALTEKLLKESDVYKKLLPDGGTDGQVLRKSSYVIDQSAEWSDIREVSSPVYGGDIFGQSLLAMDAEANTYGWGEPIIRKITAVSAASETAAVGDVFAKSSSGLGIVQAEGVVDNSNWTQIAADGTWVTGTGANFKIENWEPVKTGDILAFKKTFEGAEKSTTLTATWKGGYWTFSNVTIDSQDEYGNLTAHTNSDSLVITISVDTNAHTLLLSFPAGFEAYRAVNKNTDTSATFYVGTESHSYSWSNAVMSNDVNRIKKLTQAEYDALVSGGNINASTLYIII